MVEADLLVQQFCAQLKALNQRGPVLDLACGSGKNGLYLARAGLHTVFADINSESLQGIEKSITQESLPATVWPVDFETSMQPDNTARFSAIVVYRYLHRALFDWIKQALLPGGLLIYSTFTYQQVEFGRPRRAEFLLQEHELRDVFYGWPELHYWQGIKPSGPCAMAEIVTQKPYL